MMRKTVGTALLLALLAGGAVAEETAPEFSWGLVDAKLLWGFIPSGLVFDLGYGPWEAKVGAGYSTIGTNRDDTTGDPLAEGVVGHPAIDKFNGQFELGPRQGLVSLDSERDFVSAWVSLHGRAEVNLGTRIPSIFPDRNDAVLFSLLSGLDLDNTLRSEHGVKTGIAALVEGEWGPKLLSFQGTDFWRFKIEGTAYVPVFDLPSEKNLLSGYLVVRANAKVVDGTQVPLFALEETDVRGYPTALDAQVRTYGTAEFRLNLPSLVGKASLLATLFAFADAGTYAGYTDIAAASPYRGASGTLLAVGGGLALDVFQAASVTFTVAQPLIGPSRPFWIEYVGLGLHID